jgi:hypothetical protein
VSCNFYIQTLLPIDVRLTWLSLGKLTWSRENFSDSVTDVDLRMEGPNNEPILHAQLDDGEGNICSDELNLSSCIKNEDGHLRYMQCF